MKLLKAAAAVLNQTPLDWYGNKSRIVAAIRAARDQSVGVLCLPELCITGYGCEDAFHSPGVLQTAEDVLLEILPETRGLIVSLGLPRMHGGAVFNTCCLAADGDLLGFVAKQNLAGDGIHYEPRWFKPWPNDLQAETELAGRAYPMGDLMFDCGGVRIGFEICEDAWVGSRPGAEHARRGADILLNPSASHFAFGKHEVRRRFVLEGSRAFHVHYVYANLVGNEAGRAIYDGDAMIASAGRMAATGPRFSFVEWHLTTAVLDIDATRLSRARSVSFVPQILRDQPDVVRRSFSFPSAQPQRESAAAAWESGPHVKEEEFARAVALGLFDYLRKSRSRGFVVSISGGADSAAVATLCALAVKFAATELGRAGLFEKLAHTGISFAEPGDSSTDGSAGDASAPRELPGDGLPDDAVESISRQLLLCVYQATRNSSETTERAARGVAESLGAEYMRLDVDELVQGYIGMIEQAIGRELRWEQDDIALQNIQARVRSPSVWMLANLRGALLLSTSNRSEAAVGYATMDGDTSGGLSPIAGIDKAFLRHWLRWMESAGPAGIGPLPSLALVNSLPPTAELRPQESKQTDEADLMPYDVLDAIERAAIRDKLTPVEVFQRLAAEPGDLTTAGDAANPRGFSPEQLAEWIERFFRLWSRNQWKRERYAPSFHLDDENLDPKTWCRFPILSGGFARELAALRELVSSMREA